MRPLAVLVLVIVVACSAGETTPATTPETTAPTLPPVTTTSTIHPPSSAPPVFEEVSVGLSDTAEHLVDEQGNSLYLFTLDTDRTSTCRAECAEAWPPLLGDPVAASGVDQALLGNAERGNGSIQVTYGGYPLYRYGGDEAPGDTAGHGFNDLWFLMGPDGEPLEP